MGIDVLFYRYSPIERARFAVAMPQNTLIIMIRKRGNRIHLYVINNCVQVSNVDVNFFGAISFFASNNIQKKK